MSTSLLPNPSNLIPNQVLQGYDRTQPIIVEWDCLTPDPTLVKGTSVRVEYRLAGAGSWTLQTIAALVESPANSGHFTYTFPGSAFSAGIHTQEWRVTMNDTLGGATDPSNAAQIQTFDAAVAPTITAPTAGQTITATTFSVTWTVTTQAAYRLRVLNGTVVEYDSGPTANSGARAATVTLPTNGSRTIELTVQQVAGGPWSTAVTKAVTVAWTVPTAPTITTATTIDFAGIGMRHALSVSGAGGSYDFVTLWVRRVGDTGPGVAVITQTGPFPAFTYHALPQDSWQVKVVGLLADGRTNESAWTTLTLQPNLRGVVLNPPGSSTGIVALTYNEDEESQDISLPSDRTRYVGKRSPIVEFDATAEDRSISADKLTVKTVDAASLSALLALLRARTAICYRDKRGRKIVGQVEVGSIADTFYGWTLSLKVTETDYPADALAGV